MPVPRPSRYGPIRFGAASTAALAPVSRARISDGLWGERRRINREVSVPHAWERLRGAGNFANLELAAATESGQPAGVDGYVNELPFLDSDLYKWLEAIGWTLADPALSDDSATELRSRLSAAIDLLRRVQAGDGYLDSHFQVRFPGERFVQLPWGHELYCAGHLIQAAVAVHRGHRRDRAARHRPPVRRSDRDVVRHRGRSGGRCLRPSGDRDRAGRAAPRDRRVQLSGHRAVLRRPPGARAAG